MLKYKINQIQYLIKKEKRSHKFKIQKLLKTQISKMQLMKRKIFRTNKLRLKPHNKKKSKVRLGLGPKLKPKVKNSMKNKNKSNLRLSPRQQSHYKMIVPKLKYWINHRKENLKMLTLRMTINKINQLKQMNDQKRLILRAGAKRKR